MGLETLANPHVSSISNMQITRLKQWLLAMLTKCKQL